MYTQCPHCQTCFRISEAHLKVANGKVRCGSCQEVFDATQSLFRNLTDREPVTDFKQPPPKTAPAPAPRAPAPTTQPSELSTPPAPVPKNASEIRRERDRLPDQSAFMESTVGSDRYNDLDQMGAIKIPGEINFGDSFIKFPEAAAEPATPSAETAKAPRTQYEDLEAKQVAATTADHAAIDDFFAQVDKQLNGDAGKSQLDKDIDELLAFAKGLDLDSELDKPTPPTQKPAPVETRPPDVSGIEVEEEFDLHAIAEFEKELAASSTGVFAAQQAQPDESSNLFGEDLARPAAPSVAPPEEADNETVHIELDAAALPAEHAAPAKTGKPPRAKAADITHDEFEFAPPDKDLPRALRRSLDSLNTLPRRSLWQTLLMLLFIVVLLGGLGFQTVLFRNVELAHAFPALIPVLSKVCDRIPCRYSGQVDVSQIKLLSRDVRSDPSQPNALLISAAFVNQAPFDQPYPILQITLYDLGGNVVASRRFTQQEYLGEMYNRFLLMESGTPVHVTLAVLDPGNDAINFEFSFL